MAQNELRILLLGPTGSGKSATGNSLLRRNAFRESDDPQTGTVISKTCEADNIIPGYTISVTDTPGLCSTATNPHVICSQVMQFIGQLSPGPHVIILVISAGQRVSIEVRETIETFCNMFGEQSINHMMFLFTKTDLLTTRFNPEPKPIEEWVEQLCTKDQLFNDMFTKCGKRFQGINNRLLFTTDAYQQQIGRLMDSFLQIVNQNGGLHYTNENIDLVEDILIQIDGKTEDRGESRQVLTSYLVDVGAAGVAGLAGGAAFGGLQAAEAGAGLLSSEAAAAALGAGILGGGIAAAGAVGVAGISFVCWGIYKKSYELFADSVQERIKKDD